MSTTNYNPNTPLAKDIFASSSKPFMNNFQDMFTAFLKNHISLTAGALAGNHTIIQLTEQNAPFQTDVGEISVYTKDVEGQTDQIFMRYQGNQQEFQYSNYQIYSIPPGDGYIPYFTFLPGKVLLYFGAVNVTFPDFTFKFNPPIVRNIISMNFCLWNTVTPAVTYHPPYISIPDPINNIYTSMILNPAFNTPAAINPALYYYMVMANV